jgi:cysteinyl-tRNA synthetase
MALSIYNTLSRTLEEFQPLQKEAVGLYTCGPTVYDYVTIGNWRTYTLGDIIARVLVYDGYITNYYMNITDVGHLTGDNAGDADTGEDRMEKAKKREGKTAWDIAKFYTEDFKNGYKELHLTEPAQFLKATDYIAEQIALVETLLDKNLAYKTDDGIYFDTVAYERLGFKYGELSNLDQIKEGARVEVNTQKRNPRDFALWKFSPMTEKRDMEWPSPWGVGFPGWHVECSAMSMKFLGEQFDVHVGGEDLKSTHHPNEIAQSQGATGKHPFVKYWLHGAFLQVDGGRMGKSLGNAYTLHDIEKRGITPLALRYFYFGAHYRSPLNFSWEALEASDSALKRLLRAFEALDDSHAGTVNSQYQATFSGCINDDLNMPRALALVWDLVRDTTVKDEDKRATLLDFDKVLGFGFADIKKEVVPDEVEKLVRARVQARHDKDWAQSDQLREHIKDLGYEVKDTDGDPIVTSIAQ